MLAADASCDSNTTPKWPPTAERMASREYTLEAQYWTSPGIVDTLEPHFEHTVGSESAKIRRA